MGRIGLAQHLPEHMHDPGTLAVDHLFVRGSRLGGGQAHAHDERAGFGRRAVFVGSFGEKSLAVAVKPGVESVVRVLLGIGKKKREIIGDGFVDPLIAVAGPAHDIPPPLVSDLVKRKNLREEFLVGRVEAGTLLVFWRQERVRGDVEKSRPPLPEGAWNLRDAEMTKRKGTGILFAEMDGGIDFTGKLLQGVRGTWSRGFHGDACVWKIASGNTNGRTDIQDGTAQAGLDGLFELLVCVDVNGMVLRGHRSHCVFAQVETRLGDRLFRLPVRDAEVALFVLVRFFARGDEVKTLGPTQGHIVEGEFGGVAMVGEPAFALADEKDGVTGVFDDVAAIAEIQGKGFASGKRLGEENTDGIFTVVAQLLRGEALVLEKGERSAGLEGDGFDPEGTRELDEEELFAAGDRTEIDGGIPFKGVVRVDGGVDVVPQRSEGNQWRRISGRRVGTPDVVMHDVADEAGLPGHEIFPAHFIGQDVKRAGDNAINSRMEEMPGRGRKLLEQDAQGVGRIETRDIGLPGGHKGSVGRGLEAGALKLHQEVLGGVISEAHVGGDKLLVQEGCPQETCHLLLFRGIARKGKSVTQTGEDKAGNAAFKWSVKGEASLLKSEDGITMTDFDVVRSSDRIDVL